MAIKNNTVESNAIPPNFGKDNTTLICVIIGKKKYDKKMKKHVENEYHGKYEFVLRENLNSDEFKDTSNYRYIFDIEKIEKTSTFYVSGRFQTRNVIVNSLGIFDRQAGIMYKSNVTSSFSSKIIQAYMINLEKERLKNQ